MSAATDDATVEAVPDEEIEPADTGLPPVASREIAHLRERYRGRVACGVIGATGLLALAVVTTSLATGNDPPASVEHYFTAMVGLCGAVIGWYFGGGSSKT